MGKELGSGQAPDVGDGTADNVYKLHARRQSYVQAAPYLRQQLRQGHVCMTRYTTKHIGS